MVVEAQQGLRRGGGPAVQLVVVAAAGQLPVVRRPLQAAHLPQRGSGKCGCILGCLFGGSAAVDLH